MRRFSLAPLGSLCLMLGAAVWPSTSAAQGLCYLVNDAGQVVNLDDLCQGDRPAPDPADSAPADSAPASAAPQDSLPVETESDGAVRVNRVTIVGPATTSPADIPEAGAAPADPDAVASPQPEDSADSAADPAAEDSGRVLITPSGVQILN